MVTDKEKIKEALEYIEERLDEEKMKKRTFVSSLLLRDIKGILENDTN